MKKTIVLILVLVLCAALAGCGPNPKVIPQKDQNQSAEQKSDNNTAQDKTTLPGQEETKPAPTQTEKQEIPSKNPVRAKPGKDKFKVDVSISNQQVEVFENDELIKTITCSTGLPGKDTETPVGNYKIDSYYGLSFYNKQEKEGGMYWVGFIGANFLFHSVPIDDKGNIIEAEAERIGTQASHGCVRMPVEDAYWFYETVPEGSDVSINQ